MYHLIRSLIAGQPVPITGLFLFRTGFGFSVVLKGLLEPLRGQLHMYDEGRYLNFLTHLRYRRLQGWLPSGRQFRVALLLRIPAGLAIMLGIVPQPASAVLAAVLLLEYLIYPKFHTCYMFLLAVALIVAPTMVTLVSVLHGLATSGLRAEATALDGRTSDPTAASLVVITTTALYVFGGLRKCNRQYLSGLTVVSALKTIGPMPGQRRHFDSWRPAALRDAAALDKLVWRPYLVAAMAFVMFLEISLPFGLSFHETTVPFLVAGLAMHAAFLLLMPLVLTPFGLATLSTYALFAIGAA
jgi:hypothetical protein